MTNQRTHITRLPRDAALATAAAVAALVASVSRDWSANIPLMSGLLLAIPATALLGLLLSALQLKRADARARSGQHRHGAAVLLASNALLFLAGVPTVFVVITLISGP